MASIMIIDDDEDFVNSITIVLQGSGHEIQSLLETKNALRTLEEHLPDLLILDVMFPENSNAGFELANEIRQNEKVKKVPILMLTAVNQEFPFGFSAHDKDGKRFLKIGFLEKPIDFDVLKNKVSEILEKSARE